MILTLCSTTKPHALHRFDAINQFLRTLGLRASQIFGRVCSWCQMCVIVCVVLTCLYEVVADVGFSYHWKYVRLTPLHCLTPATEWIDQQQQSTGTGQHAFAKFCSIRKQKQTSEDKAFILWLKTTLSHILTHLKIDHKCFWHMWKINTPKEHISDLHLKNTDEKRF